MNSIAKRFVVFAIFSVACNSVNAVSDLEFAIDLYRHDGTTKASGERFS